VNYAIVTPIWKESLTDSELRHVSFTHKNVDGVDHYFAHPVGMNLTYYKERFASGKYHAFDSYYFQSVSAYSKLMLTNDFYCAFDAYEAIVICQTDAFMLRGVPENVMEFDYIGAPWPTPFRLNRPRIEGNRRIGWLLSKLNIGKLVYVGNGGLSWRRIDAFRQIEGHLRRNGIRNPAINEDLVIAYLAAHNYLKVPTSQVAEGIFVEGNATNLSSCSGMVGFHALEKFNPKLMELIFKGL